MRGRGLEEGMDTVFGSNGSCCKRPPVMLGPLSSTPDWPWSDWRSNQPCPLALRSSLFLHRSLSFVFALASSASKSLLWPSDISEIIPENIAVEPRPPELTVKRSRPCPFWISVPFLLLSSTISSVRSSEKRKISTHKVGLVACLQ